MSKHYVRCDELHDETSSLCLKCGVRQVVEVAKRTRRNFVLGCLFVACVVVMAAGCSAEIDGRTSDNREASVIDEVPEEVEQILKRNIFEFKEDLPWVYTSALRGIDVSRAYTENWIYGKILNDNYYENITWERVAGVDGYTVISFYGKSNVLPYYMTTYIEFCIGDEQSVPLAWLLRVETDSGTTEISIQSFIDQGMDKAEAIVCGDAAISCMMTTYSESLESNEDKGDSSSFYEQEYMDTGYSAYDAKIEEYRVAATIGIDDFLVIYNGKDSSINSFIVEQLYYYGGVIAYSLYDVDDNGTPELIISDLYNVVDIYTISNARCVRLFGDCSFGDRSRLHILSGGRLLSEGSTGASSGFCEMCRIGSDAKLLVAGAYYFDSMGPNDYSEDYIYISESEYYNLLNTWLADSLFDRFEWNVIAEYTPR